MRLRNAAAAGMGVILIGILAWPIAAQSNGTSNKVRTTMDDGQNTSDKITSLMLISLHRFRVF